MIGAKIAQLREAKGETREQLAKSLRLDPSTVAYWERDDSTPRKTALRRLARHFGVTVADLFTRKAA